MDLEIEVDDIVPQDSNYVCDDLTLIQYWINRAVRRHQTNMQTLHHPLHSHTTRYARDAIVWLVRAQFGVW